MEHSTSILKIAESCFTSSRFHLDPNIDNSIANQIKKEWVRNYIKRKRGNRLIVAVNKKNNLPLGFLAEMLMHNTEKIISLIDLIGVDKSHHGKGIGNELISWMMKNQLSKKTNTIRVVTQVANIQSIRFYENVDSNL